jgi:hypothetical protein
MATRNTPKGATKSETPATPSREELLAAYQVHTLSQILYGRMTAAYAPQTMPMHGMYPWGGYGETADPQTPPVVWGYPYGWYR